MATVKLIVWFEEFTWVLRCLLDTYSHSKPVTHAHTHTHTHTHTQTHTRPLSHTHTHTHTYAHTHTCTHVYARAHPKYNNILFECNKHNIMNNDSYYK